MATIKDVANLAGVSISTVSHVVNKTRYVSPELMEKVQKAICQLEYPPNFVIKKQKQIKEQTGKGILLLKFDNNSFLGNEIETKIISVLKQTPYFLVTINYPQSMSEQDFEEAILSNPQYAGVIFFPGSCYENASHFLNTICLPSVSVSTLIENINANYIVSDTGDGTYKAILHLLRNGHEQIAFVSGDLANKTNRYKAYCKALEENGISVDENLVHTGVQTREKVFSAMDAIFNLEVHPTAVFAATYSVAAPIFQYIDSHNIRCPQDISVICFNDFDWASLHTPPITVVRQDAEGIAKAAVGQLIDLIESDSDVPNESQKIILPTKLIIRSSTAGIAHGPFGEKAGSIESLWLTDKEKEIIGKHNYSAAISFHYTGKAWMDLLLKGITSVFKQLNISLIATTDAHFDPDLQCRQLESLCVLKPDVIISMPTDNKKTSSAFQNVVKSQSKLILITNVPEGLVPGDYVSCISVNERSHGRNIGHGLGEYMTMHGLKNVLIIKHGADFFATNQRDGAAVQILSEEYPNINICAETSFLTEENVYDVTLEAIQKHPNVDAVYISWEGPAMEVMRAMNDAGRYNIAVATGDLDYNTALVMARGGMIKAISAQCPYEQGQAIALAAANALLGKTPPAFIGIEPVSVTPDNLLKKWTQIFKEDPPLELKETLKGNMPYISDYSG